MYILEKMQVEEGKYSMLPAGYRTIGTNLAVFLAGKYKATPIKNIHKIKVGRQVLLTRGFGTYHQTSPVSEILEKGPNYVIFKTQTSIYTLSEEHDDEDV